MRRRIQFIRVTSVCFTFICSMCVSGQSIDKNGSYFKELQETLSKDTSIKTVKYICNRFKNGEIEDQHVFVKYKNDDMNRFWRIGKCYHYYKSGLLRSNTNVDPILKRHVGANAFLNQKQDTAFAVIWGDLKGKGIPVEWVFKQKELGKVYEMNSDKYTEVKFEKGKRKWERIWITPRGYEYLTRMIYYNKDGTINKIKDFEDPTNGDEHIRH